MKTEILTILKQNEGYTSGQELCDRLEVSRTAVWKVINQLKEEGYEIDAVKNKGYKIVSTPDILSESEIKSCFNSIKDSDTADYNIVFLEETDSTNTYAKILAEQGAPDKTVVIANHQAAGKGRRGRSFDSPKNVGAFVTFMYRPDIDPSKASLLTLVSALAVHRTIEKECGLVCQIKWPNDIIDNGKKICGILTEMSTESDYINNVVVGIGININNEGFNKEIEEVARSIRQATGKKQNRSRIVARLINEMDYCYETFMKTKDLSLLKDEYDKNLINVNKEVRIVAGDNEFTGISRGIAPDGELLVEANGQIKKVMSGEVSVRGVYGYV